MIKIIPKGTSVDFIGKRKVAITVSVTIALIGLIFAFTKGFNVGIDFSGGTMVQILFEKKVEIEEIRKGLKGMDMGDSEIQHIGDEEREFLIRAESSEAKLQDTGELIKRELEKVFPGNAVELRRVEMVGPKVGKDLRGKAFSSFLYAIVFMLIYIWWRFELSFGVGAIVALMHDITLTVGMLAIAGIEFDLKVVAAILTVVGYSINDTIVVYDRIRENLKSLKKEKSYEAMINRSVNQTLNRTIITSLTSLFVVLILFFFGGEVIHGFAFTLLIGIITGTYSSIYIASPIVLLWASSPGKRLTQRSTT